MPGHKPEPNVFYHSYWIAFEDHKPPFCLLLIIHQTDPDLAGLAF
jgi:hypothetical protein